MTRKDYVLLAEALRIVHRRYGVGTKRVVEETAQEIADALAADNSRFDSDHFLAVVRGEKDLHSRP